MQGMDLLIFVLEVIGSAAFAVTGVITAAKKRLDIFGTVVLGTITAVGGGLLRDIFLGITPPTIFVKPVYTFVAMGTSFVLFVLWYIKRKSFEVKINNLLLWIDIFDSLGLAVFVSVGINTAVKVGYTDNVFLLIFVGTITGVGGGILRDTLAGQIPAILQKKVYAIAAIAGGCIQYILFSAHFSIYASSIIGMIFTLLIRFLAMRFKWNLPKFPED